MAIVFVQRSAGVICGVYARLQPAIAEESIDESDPEVLAYLNPPPPTLDQIYDATLQTQRVLKAVVLALNDGSLPIATNKTPAQLKAIIKAKM